MWKSHTIDKYLNFARDWKSWWPCGLRLYQLFWVHSERSPGGWRRDWRNLKSVKELKLFTQQHCWDQFKFRGDLLSLRLQWKPTSYCWCEKLTIIIFKSFFFLFLLFFITFRLNALFIITIILFLFFFHHCFLTQHSGQ